MECFVIFVMAWCWHNATESKPQNVSGNFEIRMNTENDTNQNISNIIGLIILLPIILISVIGQYFISNSEDYITKKYFEFHKYEFEGEIFEKKQDQKGSGANIARYVHLKSGIIHRISVDKFYDLSVGDYVFKKAKSDTVYYILKQKKDTLKSMENNYLNEYLKFKK